MLGVCSCLPAGSHQWQRYSVIWPRRLAEGEGESLYAGVEELDGKLSVDNMVGLSDQLIQARFAYCSVAARIDVDAVRGSGSLAVKRHVEAYCRPWTCGRHHEMHITCVEADDDSPRDVVQGRRLLADCPVARERPLVECQAG